MKAQTIALMTVPMMALAACGSADDGGAETATVNTAEQTELGAQSSYQLAGADGENLGTVMVSEDANGMTVAVQAMGLEPGTHAVHLHETGLCEGPDFSSAGGHWNPTGAQHGRDNPQGPHVGDLANMTVGEDGTGSSSFLVERAGMTTGEYRAADADGTALVIHAGADDYMTDPAGDAGNRVACAVIAPPQGGSTGGTMGGNAMSSGNAMSASNAMAETN